MLSLVCQFPKYIPIFIHHHSGPLSALQSLDRRESNGPRRAYSTEKI
jgi:hypothetical protein